MEPDKIRFGGGSAATLLHPLVALAMVLVVVLIFCLPRKHAILPVLLGLFFIPTSQVIVAAGIHFTVFRIIILVGLARFATAKRSAPLVGGFNFMDRAVTLWAISYVLVYSLQYMDVQAVIKSVGDGLDGLGSYFVFRFLIRNRDDVRLAIKALATVAIVNAICMLNEQRTGQDVFAMLGGMIDEVVRDGKIRSQGSFAIFITAGSFGGTLPPLLVWLWSDGKAKVISLLGLLGAAIMSFTCYASTTLVTFVLGLFALGLWPIRKQMRLLRWGIVLVLVALHMVMHGPVWSLLEHIDLTGSSSSYHRYMLIDVSIRHFWDWWLLGTRDNGSWGWEMWDTSNQYVAYAFSGGLLTLIFFISIISRGFASLGNARKIVEGNRREEWFLWCLGCGMFAHVVAFFGIDYFDQVRFAWFTLLAIISVAVFEATKSVVPRVQQVCQPNLQVQAVAASGPSVQWSDDDTWVKKWE
jgi:hypothetical protein